MWTDSHCHIPYEGVDESVIDEARAAGVRRLVSVGTDVAQSKAAMAVARDHDGVWATAGVHPHEARHGIDGLAELLAGDEVVAVGECGLDFHYDHSPRDVQREVFAAQVALAHEHDLALVIHTREAWDATFDVLVAEGVPERTVFHCFTGGPEEARRALDLGAVLSFSGIVSFPGAADVKAAAGVCPIDRVLVETDSPYLAPVPHRGKRNRPAWLVDVGVALAEAGGWSLDQVEEATTTNAARVFRLPPEPSV